MARKKKIESQAENIQENTNAESTPKKAGRPKANREDSVFAERFVSLMNSTGKSVAEVSGTTGISKVSLNKYANGSGSANGASLVKLANCFDVSTDYLLGNDTKTGKKETDAVQRAAKLRVENDRLKRVLLSYESLHDELVSFNAALKSAT